MPIPIIASPNQLKRDVFARSICLGTWCWRSVGPSPSCWLCWVARCGCWLDMLRWMLVMRSPLSEFSSARLVYDGIHAYAKVHDSVELAYWFGTRIVSLECLLTYCLFIWHCNPALLFPSMTKQVPGQSHPGRSAIDRSFSVVEVEPSDARRHPAATRITGVSDMAGNVRNLMLGFEAKTCHGTSG